MVLSEIQRLPTNDKLTWIQSPDGLLQLEKWLSEEGLSLHKVAELLRVSPNTIYRWRTYPVIAEVVAAYLPQKVKKVAPVDLSRGAAYRIIYAYEDHKTYIRGCIMDEYTTPEELWDSIFVQQYFGSFGLTEAVYRTQYLAEIKTGLYKISNYYCLTYSTVSKKGCIKPIKPPTT